MSIRVAVEIKKLKRQVVKAEARMKALEDRVAELEKKRSPGRPRKEDAGTNL
jgi:predicted  nucleic acid-binding Zn-ribbon protein